MCMADDVFPMAHAISHQLVTGTWLTDLGDRSSGGSIGGGGGGGGGGGSGGRSAVFPHPVDVGGSGKGANTEAGTDTAEAMRGKDAVDKVGEIQQRRNTALAAEAERDSFHHQVVGRRGDSEEQGHWVFG